MVYYILFICACSNVSDWRSMHYISDCSSYLKYRFCVLLRSNLSWHDFTANIKYGIITDALSVWHKYNVIAYTVVIHGRLDTRVETRCPGGFSISCWASRSRHFSYSEIEFYFQVLVQFSSYCFCRAFKRFIFFRVSKISGKIMSV